MTDTDEDSIRRACRDTLVAYLTAVDRKRAVEALGLFTTDARVVARGSGAGGPR